MGEGEEKDRRKSYCYLKLGLVLSVVRVKPTKCVYVYIVRVHDPQCVLTGCHVDELPSVHTTYLLYSLFSGLLCIQCIFVLALYKRVNIVPLIHFESSNKNKSCMDIAQLKPAYDKGVRWSTSSVTHQEEEKNHLKLIRREPYPIKQN